MYIHIKKINRSTKNVQAIKTWTFFGCEHEQKRFIPLEMDNPAAYIHPYTLLRAMGTGTLQRT